MEYVLIVAAVVVAILICILVRYSHNDEGEQVDGRQKTHTPPATCCGAHEVCEAETLLSLSDKVIYYDDEELDRYRGVDPDEYTSEQVDEFREVLLTLQPHEVAGWLRSLNLRQVDPPTDIRDEALMVVSDFREQRRQASQQHSK